ncbi:unnamed protein product [Lepidochelys kempii]
MTAPPWTWSTGEALWGAAGLGPPGTLTAGPVSVLDSKKILNLEIFLKQFKSKEVRKLRAFQGPWSQLSDAETFSLLLVGVPSYDRPAPGAARPEGGVFSPAQLAQVLHPDPDRGSSRAAGVRGAAHRPPPCPENRQLYEHGWLRWPCRRLPAGISPQAGRHQGNKPGMDLLHFVPWRLSGRTRACWISRANWSTWGWHHGSRSRRWHRSCRAWVSPWRGPAAASWSWAQSRLHESCCARPRPRCATSSARPRRRSACRLPLECRTPSGGASGLPCRRTMQAEQRRQENCRNRHVLRPGAGAGCPVHTHAPAVPPEPHPPGPPPKHWALCQPGLWGRGLP